MLLPVAFSLLLSTPTGILPDLSTILPSLDRVLTSVETVLQREGRIVSLDTSSRTRLSPKGLDPGADYQPGTYPNVPLIGSSSGSGAKATVVVGVDGSVQSVSLTAFGRDYSANDQLTAPSSVIGGGSGFSVDVASVASTLPSLDEVLPVLGGVSGVLPTLEECYRTDPVTQACIPGYTR